MTSPPVPPFPAGPLRPDARPRIAPEDHDARLDAALARLLPLLEPVPALPLHLPPNAGLRIRRRLWQTHAVLLDGHPARPGTRVRAGQRVELRPLGAAMPAAGGMRPSDAPRVLTETGGLAALYKPGGLHSASIAGSVAPSMEALLPALLGMARAAAPPDAENAFQAPCLLNRLDGPTSGILLAAYTLQAARRFHAAEDSGRVVKTYLALAHGVLAHTATVRRALDTANRTTTRVLADDSPDPLRHTEFLPLGVMMFTEHTTSTILPAPGATPPDTTPASACPCTLVRCRIRKGARHQIRAHLAALGHPLVGDTRYGTPRSVAMPPLPDRQPASPPGPLPAPAPLAATLFLHHAHLALPGFAASCLPPWLDLLPAELQKAARAACRPAS